MMVRQLDSAVDITLEDLLYIASQLDDSEEDDMSGVPVQFYLNAQIHVSQMHTLVDEMFCKYAENAPDVSGIFIGGGDEKEDFGIGYEAVGYEPAHLEWMVCNIVEDSALEADAVEFRAVHEIMSVQYQFLGILGQGGFGTVHLVAERCSGRELALKVMRNDSKYLCREVEVLKSLAPGRVHVIDHVSYQVFGLWSVLIMPLGQAFVIQGSKQAVNSMKQVLLCVDELHKLGFLHRDIKEQNFVWINMTVKLINLGCAEPFYNPSRVKGTPGYIGPEVLLNWDVFYDRIDEWSVAQMFLPRVLMMEDCWQKRELWKLLHVLGAVNPCDRMSAVEVLMHPMFND
eukprot:TRINITY_DN6724_c0_g1_i6.p1 TRINITY_DN6724_c0_g1~~TRINITY_DN6724_c0_g1_i6.p1  ORF type:complete len:343 (-),score=69.38 TRINITY_DN6724_c0_g1_i6:34-1062(-)